ncbi:MAG: MoaD/ThiS family protein [Chitinophagaceae bacterium]
MKILAFGVAKDIVGGSSFAVELTVGKSVADLRGLLNSQYPGLMRLSSYLIAVNGEYASAELALTEKDEIAIIPPVSGG